MNNTTFMNRRIGQGFCGTVWSSEMENARAIKREDGGPGRSLRNDYIMHQKIRAAMDTACRVYLPVCYEYVHADDSNWWTEHLPAFPEDYQVPCNVLVSDRIPPFSEATRNKLVDLYCPTSLKPSIKLSEPDRDCLIRPYLGRRRRLVRQSRFQAFSLRNYPLHIDQIEDLRLDDALYAEIMAETLAELYWNAHVDANDVEFVLAPPRKDNGTHTEATIQSNALGEHVIWLLEFACCKHMPLDEMGVEQAVAAFYRNDPFYPRPGQEDNKDEALWRGFKDRFLERSAEILGQESPGTYLPALWVDLVEQRA
ncbi:hypothetical protein PVAG01_09042 [Phlyctema vagabunda]|uniref:DUF3669 domain-containing protein n=1 Tax=Phlyctema vagabunda TaxID=108571 RepID=A0ABR4P6V2_9HELO